MGKQDVKPSPIQVPNPEYDKKIAELESVKQDLYSNFGNIVRTKAYDPFFEMQPYSFNPNATSNQGMNFERYYSHSDFKKLGYNPWADNEALYNEKGSAGGDVQRAGLAALRLAGTGFMSPIRSYGDMFSGDTFTPDYESGEEMGRLNAIGSSTRGGGSGFMSNLITNSGYTLGIIGEMALETALTAALFPAGAPATAMRLGKHVKDFGKISTAVEGVSKTVNQLKNFNVAKAAWEATKATGKFINPLENVTEAVLRGVRGVKTEGLASLAKNAPTAGDFFRDLQMINATISEAKLEGAMTEQDVEEQLRARIKARKNGQEPTYEEMIEIKKAAADAGAKTLAWNIPTIFLTNKITFQPLLKSFTKANEYTLRNGVKFMQKGNGEFVEATFTNKVKAALKPKNFLVAPVKYFKQNFSEGLQETAQEIISGTSADYYKDLFWNNRAKQGLDFGQATYQNLGVWDALSSNVADQFTGKGFEVFASGFLMGGLVGPVRGGLETVMGFRGAKYKEQRRQYAKRTIATLNEMYKDPLKFFAPNVINYANGAQAVVNQNQAEESGQQKEWLDAESENLVSQVMTAFDTGTYDVFLDKLRAIKTMDEKSIKDAYGIEGSEVLSKIDKIISRAEKVKDNYQKWTERYPNPFDLRAVDKERNPEEYKKVALGFVAWENARKYAIFNEATFGRNAERIQNMANDILKTEELSKVTGNDISLLFSPRTIETELKLLDNELEVLEGGEIKGDRTVIAVKRAKQRKLQKFYDALKGYYLADKVGGISETARRAIGDVKKATLTQLEAAYQDYIAHLGTAQVNVVSANKLDLGSSFAKLKDIHDLSQENVMYAEMINILADPKGFISQYERMQQVFSDLYNSREEIVKNSIENSMKLIEDNTVLNALYKRGFVLTPDNVERLMKRKEVPSEFFDINAKQAVSQNDPRYAEFVRIITPYIEGTGEKTETASAQTETGTDPAQGTNTGSAQQGETSPVEPVTTTIATVEQQPKTTSSRPEFSVDIEKKFSEVITGQQLDLLENELTTMMLKTTLEERKKNGITSQAISERIKLKEKELAENLTFENVQVGNILALNDSKDAPVVVIRKSATSITYRPVGDNSTKVMVAKDRFKQTFKLKYSDQMDSTPPKASPEEAATAKANSEKFDNFLNDKDRVSEIVKDAYAREAEFIQEFENSLGCK